jgi:hypothetical protein
VEEMTLKIPYDPMFDPAGSLRCEDCAAHESSAEGRETSTLFTRVYELAGYGLAREHPHDRDDVVPDELHLRRAYYSAYHGREHLSYAELDLEEMPESSPPDGAVA